MALTGFLLRSELLSWKLRMGGDQSHKKEAEERRGGAEEHQESDQTEAPPPQGVTTFVFYLF